MKSALTSLHKGRLLYQHPHHFGYDQLQLVPRRIIQLIQYTKIDESEAVGITLKISYACENDHFDSIPLYHQEDIAKTVEVSGLYIIATFVKGLGIIIMVAPPVLQ